MMVKYNLVFYKVTKNIKRQQKHLKAFYSFKVVKGPGTLKKLFKNYRKYMFAKAH